MSDDTLTVRVPLALRKRGGRKVVLAPDQAAGAPEQTSANWTLVKNLARAFRWQRMLESGEYATIIELAAAEGVTDSYVSRILKLALTPPSEVDGIVRNARGPTAGVPHLAEPATAGRHRAFDRRTLKLLPLIPIHGDRVV